MVVKIAFISLRAITTVSHSLTFVIDAC
jgi:hypothetical protein